MHAIRVAPHSRRSDGGDVLKEHDENELAFECAVDDCSRARLGVVVRCSAVGGVLLGYG